MSDPSTDLEVVPALDVTDDIIWMLENDLESAPQLALTLLRHLMDGATRQVLYDLCDALLPPEVGSTLAHGDTARTLLYGALHQGVDLVYLRSTLETWLQNGRI